jgi:hypothetical protein
MPQGFSGTCLLTMRIEQRLWHVGRVLENKVQEVVVGFVPGFDLRLQALDLLELLAF